MRNPNNGLSTQRAGSAQPARSEVYLVHTDGRHRERTESFETLLVGLTGES